MSSQDNTPIIVGVGQFTQPVPEDLQACMSHYELAAEASRHAIEDANCATALGSHIDTVVGVRTFADSTPTWGCPFGGSNNFPRSVANRVGADPKRAVYEVIGGQSPQKLVGEYFEKLNAGECEMVLLTGGEAMASIKVAGKQKVKLDWREKVDGSLDDRGRFDGFHMVTRMEFEHKLLQPIQFYGLMEQARRGELGMDESAYNSVMAQELSKLSEVAANNPYSMYRAFYSQADLLDESESNPMICSPYRKHLVAKDGVNQAAALLLTTVGKAKSLGIPQDKWVFLHGYADTKERVLLKREKLGRSQAMAWALKGALSAAGKDSSEIDQFDIYSCFPIVISEARDILGITQDDPRPLTQTGGLAFFGGPGNNYTMHGIASLIENLRTKPGTFGMAYGNGGWMSKHSVGVYSTQAPTEAWQACDSQPWQAFVDEAPDVETELYPQGEAVLEAYTINCFKGNPLNSVVIGRLKDSGKRFYAVNPFFDAETLQQTLQGDKLGSTIYVEADPKGNRYAYSEQKLAEFSPQPVHEFKDSYEFNKVERDGHILKVTMNRPEARNALHPPANQELEDIFNAFEAEDELWAAIITAEGDASFSAGNDLKYMASGQEFWIPKTGFAGLTSRVNRTKPIIAAVNGLALGGGLEIAMATDIIVAVDHAQFGLPEVKVGLFAGAGGVQRLGRQIGTKKAMEMMLTGEPINAEEALEAGLINYVVSPDQLLAKAEELAEKITAVSPVSVRASMQLYNESSTLASTDEAVTMPHSVFDNLLNSEDFFEGSTAFAQKRKPQWRGR
ncbi:hypothetical protein R50073_07700 [Maricurvus nonylphenolicus]|uniref:enoyl-CoA hydratase-related protein n=1 Tax=Maricurvus nonylphenolicus TaxID=1008307 RepID=UPI0036F3A24D